MATHSSTLAWRIPWTDEPGGLQTTGSQSQTQLKRLSVRATNKLHLYVFPGVSPFTTVALQLV